MERVLMCADEGKELRLKLKELGKFVVYGEPQALKRHRSYRMKGKPMVMQYDPSKGDKRDFLSIVQSQKPDVPWDCPLHVEIGFFFSRPKSHYGTGKNSEVLKVNAPICKTSKPDKDNLEKFVNDALNGVFWRDDSSIVSSTSVKLYSSTPRVEVEVYQVVEREEEEG